MYIVAFQLCKEGYRSSRLLSRSTCNIHKASHFSWYQHTCKLHLRCSSSHSKPMFHGSPSEYKFIGTPSLKSNNSYHYHSTRRRKLHLLCAFVITVSLEHADIMVHKIAFLCICLLVQALHVDFLLPRISHIVDTHSSLQLLHISRDFSSDISQPLGNAVQETTVIWAAEVMRLLRESLGKCIGKIRRPFPITYWPAK